MENELKSTDVLRYIARYGSLILGITIFIASFIFGADDYGGGIKGIIKNAPNALPWAGLLLIILIAWKWELAGGILLTIFGIWLVYFFNFSGPNFWWATFIVTLLFPIFGILFILSSNLRPS